MNFNRPLANTMTDLWSRYQSWVSTDLWPTQWSTFDLDIRDEFQQTFGKHNDRPLILISEMGFNRPLANTMTNRPLANTMTDLWLWCHRWVSTDLWQTHNDQPLISISEMSFNRPLANTMTNLWPWYQRWVSTDLWQTQWPTFDLDVRDDFFVRADGHREHLETGLHLHINQVGRFLKPSLWNNEKQFSEYRFCNYHNNDFCFLYFIEVGRLLKPSLRNE